MHRFSARSLLLLSTCLGLFSQGSAVVVAKRAPESSSVSITSTSTSTAPIPISTACGDLRAQAENETNPIIVFYASDVYDCLISVPFNGDVANRFIKYYNDTIQFQSNLAYLKDPPASYQQPATDLVLGLEKIQAAVNSGFFKNQYDFEATLQQLILSAHDTHLSLQGGILEAFSFGSEYGLVSVSLDGKEIPKVYISNDIIGVSQGLYNISSVSAVTHLNGIDVVEYLTGYAKANSQGGLEAHADWNQLMESPALDVQAMYSSFGGNGIFYPGATLNFTFANGTTYDDYWYAIYNGFGETGPLETGGDFYNFFVLGLYPASFMRDVEASDDIPTTSSTTATSTTIDASVTATSTDDATPTPSGWNTLGYPEIADLVQPDLSVYGGGVLTAYFDNDTSTAMLSIPSFTEYGDAVSTFQTFVYYFLSNATSRNMKNILIDVQQNQGGDFLLAVDTFKQFFPSIDPFGGSRKRAHETANVLGTTITQTFDDFVVNSYDYWTNSSSEWVATDRLNAATNQNFSSWAEYYGPRSFHNDYFTQTQRDNYSSVIFDYEASGGIIVAGYTWKPLKHNYTAKNIAILSDALCASACAAFMEMMHHEAGVPTVVVGGRPSYGPMQAPSGTRGAAAYDAFSLDADFNLASALNFTAEALLPQRDNNNFYFDYAGFTIRDQVRRHENIPLQFVYEAADCRIFFTPETVYNFTNLWKYAAEAVWTNPSLCVKGSTGYSNTNETITTMPSGVDQASNITTMDSDSFYNIQSHLPDFPPAGGAIIIDGVIAPDVLSQINQPCDLQPNSPNLDTKLVCVSVPSGCGDGQTITVLKQACKSNVRSCRDGSICNILDKNRQIQLKAGGRLSQSSLRGFCPSALPTCNNYVGLDAPPIIN